MVIRLHCPNGHPVRVKDELAGKTGLCPKCRAQVRVPAPRSVDDVRPSEEFVHAAPAHHHPSLGIASEPLMPLAAKKTRLCLGCGHVASQSFTVCTRCGTPLTTYRRLEARKEGDTIVARFADRQLREEQTIREIAEELCSLADRTQNQRLVLDFSDVVGVSSMMLGKLVMLQMKIKKNGGELRLCKLGPEIREVLATTKLDHTLRIDEEQVVT